MTIDINGYFAEIKKIHASGKATEHSYRPALEKLFKSISPAVNAINEPKGVKVGRPDFVFVRGAGQGAQITVGHCEAKDVGLDINPKALNDFNKAQHERYVKALPNLIYTNGLDFAFYKDGALARQISIGDLMMGLQPKPDQFSVLAHQLTDFAAERLQTITSAEALAQMMAGKAVLMKDILFNALKEDKDLNTELTGQYKSFKDMLIHDLTAEDFADIYAETIAYGMFGARLHDKTLSDFSRAEALTLMPKSNPFLRNLFTYVAGPNLDERISRTVDELAEIFQATNLPVLFHDFGKFTQRNDPFIHFYETFLAAYNPAKRKARGVWYTPEPVVNFIVRAVDDVLKTEFGLSDGLADTSKVTVDWDTGQTRTTKSGRAEPVTIKKEVHRVQILDPAAGTGTFLAEVIKQIAPKVKTVAEGQWSSYVEKELIPRLHGFELLMASYAMCHTKLDMMLTELGYKPTTGTPPRLSVYLTNSLEEGERSNQTLPFAQWLSNEAKEANTIKRDMPIMCVIGNPPYSGESSNKGDWIMGLMEAYKKEPGGKEKLKEKNSKWINDDYVKFIRFAESLIERNSEGILAFITNHGYFDNPTFRGMRWHLLNTFDKIWVLDLHGNSNKKEISPDGKPDKNVFDIMQGVGIIVAARIKTQEKKSELGKVFAQDLWGERNKKYQALWKESLDSKKFARITPAHPRLMFSDQDDDLAEEYNRGFPLNKFMPVHGNGIVTKRDGLCVQDNAQEVEKILHDFRTLSEKQVRAKYQLPADVRDWRYEWARSDIMENRKTAQIIQLNYRPFDQKYIYYSGRSRGFVGWPVKQIMGNYIGHKNFGLLVPKAMNEQDFAHIFVTRVPSEAIFLSSRTGSNAMNLPLYLYPEELELDQSRRINFDPKIQKSIVEAATNKTHGKPDDLAVFVYIYGTLHCPTYRQIYKEFLKIDFPRVPYPQSPNIFWDVSAKGAQLRKLHLMEGVGATPYKFSGHGDSIVRKVAYESGVVRINDSQSFEEVPHIAWEFYIGGYQPAQKWLKDRKGRQLSFDDIRHYQKIIKILSETDRIMKTITMPL